MAEWTAEALAAFRQDSPALQVVDVWLRAGQAYPFRLAVGDINTALQYQVMQKNPILAAAIDASPPDPVEPGTVVAPVAGTRARTIWDTLDGVARLFDALATAAFVAPRYIPLVQHPTDGSRPADGVWLYDFTWMEQAELIKIMQGDMTDLESFRPRPKPSNSPAPAGEGVRDDAERLSDSGAAAVAPTRVRSGRAVSRRTGGNALAAGGARAGTAESAA